MYHKMSPKHLNGYVKEVEDRRRACEFDGVKQMGGVIAGMEGKRLMYHVREGNGQPSGTRG